MAAKKIQPKKPGVSASAKGSKAQAKVTGRKTMTGITKHRKTMGLSHGTGRKTMGFSHGS